MPQLHETRSMSPTCLSTVHSPVTPVRFRYIAAIDMVHLLVGGWCAPRAPHPDPAVGAWCTGTALLSVRPSPFRPLLPAALRRGGGGAGSSAYNFDACP